LTDDHFSFLIWQESTKKMYVLLNTPFWLLQK
jgi:hypothetical protein